MTTTITTLRVMLDTMPPSLNNLYKTITVKGISRRVLSGPAKSWKAYATPIIRNAGRRAGWDIAPKQPFAIEVVYQAPNMLMWDLDGKPKLLIDSLCDAFGVDDRYLMDLRQRKQRGPCAVQLVVMVMDL
jgi:Endodeoxyribonuclease RusA